MNDEQFERLVAQLENIGEQLARIARALHPQPTEPVEQCERCLGAGQLAPGVPCKACQPVAA